MKTLRAYLFKDMIRPTFLALFILLSIIWLMQSLRFMDLIINRGIDISTFLGLTFLLLPALLIIILPVAFFAGGTYALKRLIDDSELDALYAAGINRFQIMIPALKAALVMVVLGFLVAMYALPAGKARFKDLQHDLRSTQSALLLEEGTFNQMNDKMMVYLKRRDADGTLHNVMVHDKSDPEQPETWIAQKGQIMVNDEGFPQLQLTQGARLEVTNRKLSTLAFDYYTMDVARQIGSIKDRFRGKEERYFNQLINPQEENLRPHHKHEFMAEAMRRIVWPLSPVPMILIAGVFVLRRRKSRDGIWQRVVYASMGMLLYQSIIMVTNSMAESGNMVVLYGQLGVPVITSLLLMAILAQDAVPQRQEAQSA